MLGIEIIISNYNLFVALPLYLLTCTFTFIFFYFTSVIKLEPGFVQ